LPNILKRLVLLAIPVLAFVLPCPALAEEDSRLAQRIDTFLSAAEPNHFSGAVLVAKGDEVLFSRGYGYADYESGVKVSPETVFNIGSVTKQFTAAAVLKLVEQDKLRLGDTLGDLFDGVPEDKAGITVHQLLTIRQAFPPGSRLSLRSGKQGRLPDSLLCLNARN
jgi:CubicO group peptidase (beta-lactamase class C family)